MSLPMNQRRKRPVEVDSDEFSLRCWRYKPGTPRNVHTRGEHLDAEWSVSTAPGPSQQQVSMSPPETQPGCSSLPPTSPPDTLDFPNTGCSHRDDVSARAWVV